MFKTILIATLAVIASGTTDDTTGLIFEDSAGSCSLNKNGTVLDLIDCTDLSVGGTDVLAEINTLKSKVDTITAQQLTSKMDFPPSTIRCDECFSRDISVMEGGAWGSVFVEIEAWGGHQGGGTHGCYYHGKLSLNAYQAINTLKPVEYKSWGGCGEFLVTRPNLADNMAENRVGCDDVFDAATGTTSCEAGSLSTHGFHSNVLRIKKTAGTAVYMGPYFIRITVGGAESQAFAIKDSTSEACTSLTALESDQKTARLIQPDTEVNANDIATLETDFLSLRDSVTNAGDLNTHLESMSGTCNTFISRDFYVGQGNTWADVEAWGGHQGGGIHGAYIHGKYTVNGYSVMDAVTPVVTKDWGNCGSWEISRPAHGDTLNSCVPVNGLCSNEDGRLSIHGWHPNVMRVKFVPNNEYTFGGPFHIKVTTNRPWDSTRVIKDSTCMFTSQSCP